jgi:uncharacterized zinc-type alcohol dehydrogenase-like protein
MAIARGYAATDADQPLVPFTFERREPNADDVVISIQYCGVCHSDIHTVRNEWKNAVYPIVPGHEIAGIVTAVGDKVTKFKVGDKVGVGCFVDSCVGCATRDVDNEQYLPGLIQTYNCDDAEGKARTQGGYSDQIVVKEGYVLSIPDNLPLNASAPLLCAGITLYSPLRHWNAGPGKRAIWASSSRMRWARMSRCSASRCRRRMTASSLVRRNITLPAMPRPLKNWRAASI